MEFGGASCSGRQGSLDGQPNLEKVRLAHELGNISVRVVARDRDLIDDIGAGVALSGSYRQC